MEDISFDFRKHERSGELNMQVSSFFRKEGNKTAYVTFSDKKRQAEGEIPSCRIISSAGFTEEEVAGLELYMKQNLDMLSNMAATIDPIKAFMQ